MIWGRVSSSLAAKLGSMVVHVEEFTSADGHSFDLGALRAIAADQEVQEWVDNLRADGMVPVKRGEG